MSNNNPLEGATITVEGTKIGTITDQYGNFSLNISKIKNTKIITAILNIKLKFFEFRFIKSINRP